MKNKPLLIIIIVLSIVLIIQRSFISKTPFINPEATVKIKDSDTNEISSYFMEDYLVGVLAGEMPASFNEEALKAQAIASRTFAYYKVKTSSADYDLTTDTSSQVFINEEQMRAKWGNDYDLYLNKIKKAIDGTKDLVMVYNDEIISSYYYAMSNGYTENAKNVFNESKDYLISVPSKENTENKNFQVTKIINKKEFCTKLDINCDEGITISDLEITDARRVQNININNKIFVGTDIRKLLELRSTDFDIEISGDEIYITTRGYGHGVGMSQYGAEEMAKAGSSFVEILKHYYTNIEIANINSIKL